eukprot:3751128-Pleurochrysis_carterae.AAC.1
MVRSDDCRRVEQSGGHNRPDALGSNNQRWVRAASRALCCAVMSPRLPNTATRTSAAWVVSFSESSLPKAFIYISAVLSSIFHYLLQDWRYSPQLLPYLLRVLHRFVNNAVREFSSSWNLLGTFEVRILSKPE